MDSALRTAVQAAGVVAACYTLTAASWIQVLLLFTAASLGWCIYACRPITPKKDLLADALADAAADPVAAPIKPLRIKEETPVRHIAEAVYRFPIHKLAST